MASTTLNALSLPRKQPTVGASVRELLVAGRNLAAALWNVAFAPAAVQTTVKSAFDEAEELRAYAASVQHKDPEFACDLFAAADRHEAA